jgi:hypothetical protein
MNDFIAMKKKENELKYFFIKIPYAVLYDDELTEFSKILFGQILSLTNNAKKECHATNSWFSSKFNKKELTITRSIRQLEKKNYIIIERQHGRKIKINFDVVSKFNLKDHIKKDTVPYQKRSGSPIKNDRYNKIKEEDKNNKIKKARTKSSRSHFTYYSDITNKDIDLVLLLKNSDQFREYFLDYLVWIFDELPMIDYKTLFWIIDDYNSDNRPSELLRIISEEGLEDYIIGIIDEYEKRKLIETSDDHEYFDRFDKEAIGHVDRFHKFLHELIIE